jgi:hypothetical protein
MHTYTHKKQGEDGAEMLKIMRLVRREGMGEECYLDEAVPTILVTKNRSVSLHTQEKKLRVHVKNICKNKKIKENSHGNKVAK